MNRVAYEELELESENKICLCLFVCLKNKLNSSLSLNSTIK